MSVRRRFASRLTAEATQVLKREPEVWNHLREAEDYIALCHWNANVDNAWFWRRKATSLAAD